MTPKDKCKELYDKYLPIVRGSNLNETYHAKAKQCALIAVDEIIKELPELTPEEVMYGDYPSVDFFINERYNYWQEVRTELEKL